MTDINPDSHTKELFELLSIPSISAQSKHNKDIKKAARWLKDKFQSLNFKSEILPTRGHPVVYAERITDQNPPATILIYGHYDVQSPDPLDEWTTDPFKPEVRSGNIYARGASDDKGQLYTWIAAIEELSRTDLVNKLPNIKFLIEGEEETGSKNLDDFIEENKKLLNADIAIVSDTECLSESQPVITYGLRGVLYVEITLNAYDKDLHSGTYGGNVLNPAILLSEIISKLKDKNNKILIPNFYKKVRKVDKEESKDINKYPFDEKYIKKETGSDLITGEKGYTIQERAGTRPSLDVNGIWSGYTGEGEKTIIPAKASVKISVRTVPSQAPLEISRALNNYIKSLLPEGVGIEYKLLSHSSPVLMNYQSKYFKVAEIAYRNVFGKKPLYHLHGASIPVGAYLKNIIDIDTVYMGYGLPDDNLHSPNEKLSLSMFEKGIRTNIEFLKQVSKQ